MNKLLFILGLIIPLYIIRFPIWGIPTNILEVAIAFVGLVFLLQYKNWASLMKLETYHSREFVVFGSLLLLAIIGVFISQDLRGSLGVWKAYFVLPILLIWIVSQLKRDAYRVLLRGIIGSGVVVAIISIVQVVVMGFNNSFRPTALYALGLDSAVSQGGFSNYIAMYLVPIFVLTLSRKNLPIELRYTIGTILFTGIIITQSYAGIFALAGVFMIWGITRLVLRRKHSGKTSKPLIKPSIVVLVILGILLFGIWQINTPKFKTLLDMDNRNSITARVQIWDTATTMIAKSPILGIGLADFQRVYTEIIPQKYFPPYEWLVPEPHNLYFAFWLHLGIGGIIWLIVVLRLTISRLIGTIRDGKWDVYWLSLSLISIFLYGILDTPFWKNDLALLFLVILYGVIREKKKVTQ
jgi:O-antigen ligase